MPVDASTRSSSDLAAVKRTGLNQPTARRASSRPSRPRLRRPTGQATGTSATLALVDRSQLRQWIEDALARHDRDARERGEEVANVTVDEIVDAVWGRLPLEVRRQASRAQVQASLTVLTLQRGIALGRDDDRRGELGGPDGGRAARPGLDPDGARE